MNESLENIKKTGELVHDFNTAEEKKRKKRENLFISFTIKATERDQEKQFLISKLQRELNKTIGALNVLKIENEVKEGIINLKNKELETLKNENKKLQQEAQELCIKKEDIVSTTTSNTELIQLTSSKKRPLQKSKDIISSFSINLRKRTKQQ